MIKLSCDTEELKNRIYGLSSDYKHICLVKAVSEILGDISRGLVIENSAVSEEMNRILYRVDIEGETVCCNYAYSYDGGHMLRGNGLIETADGIFHVDVWIKIRENKEGSRIEKVSIDLFNDRINMTGVRSSSHIRGNIIEGLSFYTDCMDTELQNIVDALWGEIKEYISGDDEME